MNIYPSLKGFSSWKCIKYRNFAIAIKHELLKWNRLEIEFFTPNNSSKKCLQNPDICQAAIDCKTSYIFHVFTFNKVLMHYNPLTVHIVFYQFCAGNDIYIIYHETASKFNQKTILVYLFISNYINTQGKLLMIYCYFDP